MIFSIVTFGIVSVDPVDDVKSSVRAEGKQVVRGYGLSLSSLGHHEQLGQNGDRLQVNAESPQDFHHTEFMVQQKRQQDGGSQKELDPRKKNQSDSNIVFQPKNQPESVVVVVVGGFKLEEHQVNGADRRNQKEDLHRSVVNRDEIGKQIQVASHKDNREQDL